MSEDDTTSLRLYPGEPEATGRWVTPLAAVVDRLRVASPGVGGRPRVVAIDGRGGSGKTTLADRLVDAVPGSAVVHTDDWLREELPFLLRERPWARATVVAAGPARMPYDPYTALVVASAPGRQADGATRGG